MRFMYCWDKHYVLMLQEVDMKADSTLVEIRELTIIPQFLVVLIQEEISIIVSVSVLIEFHHQIVTLTSRRNGTWTACSGCIPPGPGS